MNSCAKCGLSQENHVGPNFFHDFVPHVGWSPMGSGSTTVPGTEGGFYGDGTVFPGWFSMPLADNSMNIDDLVLIHTENMCRLGRIKFVTVSDIFLENAIHVPYYEYRSLISGKVCKKHLVFYPNGCIITRHSILNVVPWPYTLPDKAGDTCICQEI